jgi:integrase
MSTSSFEHLRDHRPKGRVTRSYGRLRIVRTRHQNGWLELTEARSWKAHWFEYVRDPETGKESRRHRSKIVGEKSHMPKYQAGEELAKLLAPVNAQSSHRDNRVSLSWFVMHRWRPTVEGNWGPSTRKTNEGFVRAINAEFGETRLGELDGVDLQSWLNKLALEYSRSWVFHIYTYLRSICAAAADQDFLEKDPSRKLKRPKTRRPDGTILEWKEYQAVIDAAQKLRDQLAIKVAAGTGVRPGELFGFRWRSLEQLPNGRHALKVTETVYKCKLRPWAKTEGSADYVPLPKRLAAELQQYRYVTPFPRDGDFIFANSKGGVMDYENFEARILAPIRDKLGLSKLHFQILRRTYASRAYGERIGTLMDVQKQLRHARPDTTLMEYCKEIPDAVYTMTDSMYDQMSSAAPALDLAQMPAKGGTQ